jgi:hypothetical protein
MATTTRHSRYDPELRRQALAAYRRTRSYRKAARAIDKGVKRTHQLVYEGLKLEMLEAIHRDERNA